MNNQPRKIYAVRTNTDLTEGRGREYFKYFTDVRATAERLAKGAYVMGTDATIVEVTVEVFEDQTYVPARTVLTPPTKEDLAAEKAAREQAERELMKEQALQRARDLGMTDREIELLTDQG